MKKLKHIPTILLMTVVVLSCTDQPKVIVPLATEESTATKSSIFDAPSHPIPVGTNSSVDNKTLHQVVALEALPTQKYVYIKVQENTQEFWIATNKIPVSVGNTYFYKGGLLKRNFQSKEYNRTFDELYLVTNIVPANHGQKEQEQQLSDNETTMPKPVVSTAGTDIVTIAQIVDNPEKYQGKIIKIKGKCTKVNPNIMGRNWIHVKDGSRDSYDMVVTSNTKVPVGHEVSFTGVVSLKKDFGSGYYYDILIEKGQAVQL